MDKIWYKNPSKSEFIGRCGVDEKPECPRRTDKSRTLKKGKQTMLVLHSEFKVSRGLISIVNIVTIFLVIRNAKG